MGIFSAFTSESESHTSNKYDTTTTTNVRDIGFTGQHAVNLVGAIQEGVVASSAIQGGIMRDTLNLVDKSISAVGKNLVGANTVVSDLGSNVQSVLTGKSKVDFSPLITLIPVIALLLFFRKGGK